MPCVKVMADTLYNVRTVFSIRRESALPFTHKHTHTNVHTDAHTYTISIENVMVKI